VAGYNYAGIAWENLFAPDTVGDGPVTTNIKENGVGKRFAAIKYGSKRPDVLFRNGGTDVTNYWASNGSAVYSLPINGATYNSNNQSRGTASIRFNIYANGTYDVQDWRSSTNHPNFVSGSWLPAGEVASNWSVQIDATHNNDSVIDGGTTGAETNAPAAQPCTTDHFGRVYANAILTTDRATCTGSITVRLYRLGALRSTTTITAYCNVNGN